MYLTRFDRSFVSNPAADFRLPQPRPSTFAELVRLEPRLADLIAAASRHRATRRVTWRDYERAKMYLQRLVGWHARRPELRSSDAYDLAHRRLVAALGV